MDACSPRRQSAVRRLLAGGVLLVSGWAAAEAPASPPSAQLRAQASATSDVVRVGDVAELQGASAQEVQRLLGRVVAAAPRTGQVVRVNRAQLLAALPAGWVAGGAAAATVARAAQSLDVARLCGAAVAAVQARFETAGAAVRRSVDCLLEGAESVEVPAGEVALSVDLSHLRLVDGPQRMDVDVSIAGRPERAVSVPLKLSLLAQQWCAHAPVAAGEAIAPAAFARCLVPVRHPEQWETADAPLPTGRARRALHVGDVLATTDVAAVDSALAGDPVVVRYRAGGFELESRGSLIQDARVGDPVRVRLGEATQPVVGHLAGERLVELENQP
jgi:hypothetical protein